MKIRIIPLLQDNYSYLLFPSNLSAWLVDPAVSADVLSYLNYYLYQKQELDKDDNKYIPITNVLITHKHNDHCGQTDKLVEILNEENRRNGYLKEIEVFMGQEDKNDRHFDWVNRPISQEVQEFEREGLNIRAIKVPCHTRGHLLYHITDKTRLDFQVTDDDPLDFDNLNEENKEYSQVLFTGDTMFSSGCGRFFEGTAKDMQSNFDKIRSLDDSTHVFCGHEYTVNDVNWSLKVDPDNEILKKKQQWAMKRRIEEKETMPTTIGIEKLTNLFMRTREKELQQKLGVNDEQECMSRLREMKNHNRGLL